MDDLPIVNLVTEEKAKSMWCPFTRVPADEVAINRPLTNYAGERFKHVHCIGPRCMPGAGVARTTSRRRS